MRKICFLILTVLIILLSFTAAGCKNKSDDGKNHLVVATDATWPPMEMVNENKEIVGFDIDFLEAVARAEGFTVEFKNTAWDGIFAGLATDKYDCVISSVTITEERKAAMDFTMPYINAGQVLIVKSGMNGVTVLSDLAGKAVGAQIGTTGAFEIEKNSDLTLKTYDELGLAIEDLVNGRIDGVVADTPIAANFALQNPNYKGKLKIVGKPFTQEFYGIALKKGNQKVLEMLNRGIDKVLNSDEYGELEKKWLR